MIAPPIHQCPECSGAYDVENCAYDSNGDSGSTDWYFLCAFCRVGWEISVYHDGERFALDYHENTEPDNYQEFVKRLEAARAA